MQKTFIKIRLYSLAAVASCFVLFSITSDSFSQGRDRSKFQYIIDTSTARKDTTSSKDTTAAKQPIDSTARIKYFKFVREDIPNPSFGTYESPFFLTRTQLVQKTITFDSLNNVIISETFDGEQIKNHLKIPLDQYLEAKSNFTLRDRMYTIVSEFYKIETKDELEKLFKNITDITIPLPFTTETIFGPPTINLKINGAIDITASYQRNSSDQQTITEVSPTQNNINFKQEVQVTTKGSIGDKLTIDADWNSQRTFDYENQLKLKYTGYPDEVIQSLEAGNVSLETKSNLIGSTQALFGIKGQFKLGPLTLTAIASQKKSEKKEVDITGGSQQVNFEIPAYQYDDNNYFLDTSYRPAFEEYYYYGLLRTQALIYKRIAPDIEVWVQTTINNPNRRKAVCWIDLPEKQGGYSQKWKSQDTGQIDGRKFTGYFYKLNPGDFTLHDQAGYISLNVNLPAAPNDAVAVAYRMVNNTSVQYGDYSADPVAPDSLVLKLVRFPGLLPPTQDTAQRIAWNMKIKNIYSVGVRNIRNDPTKFSFNVYYKPPSGDNQPNIILRDSTKSYLQLTKLDLRKNGSNYDPTGQVPDGAFDFFSGYTIDLTAGAVIFPTLSPFYQTLKDAGVPDSLIHIDTTIYSNSKTDAQNSSIKFYMGGTAIGDASSRYSLGFNVVEGSVKVFNGSVQLIQGVDFTIDYSTGELVITNAGVLSAGSNLKIQYESNDLFQLASKTLLGTRLEYAFNKTSYAGFTLLNLKQQTLNDKVRIGEEPTNNTILGFDASTDIKTNFLTRLMNKIPGYNSKEESILNLKGEVAVMLPDPNTKKSIIPGDNGESVAYIDDFEGSKKIIDLGLNPLAWTVSSLPLDSTIISDTAMARRRCHFEWFNIVNNVLVTDVYPNRQVGSSSNNTLTPLALNINPYIPGMYSYIDSNKFISEDQGNPRKKWTGIFKYLNTSQTNLLDENMGFIEIWMRIDTLAPTDSAKMLIDLGVVTEKIIADPRIPFPINPGRSFHTEDKNNNGLLEQDEDNGIDGLSTAEELTATTGDNLGPDPSRDDYSWNQNSTDYSHFNGTEGNSTLNKRIDSEDMNGNGVLDEVNNYWEYQLPLNRDTTHNKYITGGGNKNWYQYRIPLNDVYKNYGNATTLTNVQYVRVWFKGFTQPASLRIVEISLVGNQWQKTNKNDTSYSISVVNIEENPSTYMSPVGGNVLRQTDPSSLDPNVLQNEQSMSLDVRKLYQGQGKFATKFFNSKPIDLLNYKILKLFVNGEPSFRYTDTARFDASMVIRLGSDSSNYYEYRAPIHPDQRPGQPWNTLNEVSINLADLTQVKQFRDTISSIPKYIRDVNGPPGAYYGILGDPTITNITQISLGVINNHNSTIPYPITGSVWFNEMRVLKTNDKSGYAYNVSAALKVSDFGNLNFSYSKVDPNFHTLEDRFGNRINSNSWDFSGTLNLHKVLNSLLSSWLSLKFKDFFTIPFSFDHSESYAKPVYLPNTDIDMETAAQNKYNSVIALDPNNPNIRTYAQYLSDQVRIASQTLTVSNRFAVTGMKFTLPSDNFFVQEMLNKLEISFYRNSSTERNPVSQSRYLWDMGGSIGMTSELKLLDQFNLSIGKFLPLGDDYKNAKMYFFFPFFPAMPLFSNNLTIGANFTRNHGDEQLRNQNQPNPTTRNFAANRNFSLDWKFIENWIVDLTGNYSFNAGSDLTYLEVTNDSLRNQRSNSQILKDIFFHNALINFGKDLNYTQAININPKFNIPVLKNFADLTTSYRSQYGWTPSLSSTNLGSGVGFSTDFQSSIYIKLKQVFDLFKGSDQSNKMQGGSNPMYQNQEQNLTDVFKLLRTFLPDGLSFTFSQSHTVANGGVSGRAGFANFWTYWGTKENYGPSRLYQLGWVNYPGTRVPNVQLQDQEGLTNSININTFINPIFPNNLKINFTYKTSWQNNKQSGYTTDALGNLTDGLGNLGVPSTIYNVRTITRPSFIFGSNIVNNLAKPDPFSMTKADEIANSFEKSVVSFPFPSWTITLNGIERFEMFQSFATSISFENSYSSDYKKTLQFNGNAPEYIASQSLTSGFTPLIGINVAFKQIEGGNLTASFKLNKTNNYDLTPSSLVINNTNTTDLAINASYSKSGFKIPLFGLSLDNDISISFSYTRTNNDPRTLKYDSGIWSDDAQTSGSISTALNPSIQYALSKNVSIQVFYKYTKIAPTQGSLQIPTTTSNEAGLNIKLTIQ